MRTKGPAMRTAVGETLTAHADVRRRVARTATRCAVLGGAAVALATLNVPYRPHTLCVLRAVTGVPCPLCGSTTAAVSVGHGDLPAALAAAPLTVVVAALLTLAPLGLGAAWWRTPSRVRIVVIA